MRIVITEFISLDGVIEDPGGSEGSPVGGWAFQFDQGEAGFADKMNGMPKYVVSSTLTDPEWNNSQVVGVDSLEELKEREGGDLLVAGSGQVARELLRRGLVDELRLMVFPVALGGGKRLFDDGVTAKLELVESRPVGPDGVVVLVYRPKSE
jgi:dihydrofolate reductase